MPQWIDTSAEAAPQAGRWIDTSAQSEPAPEVMTSEGGRVLRGSEDAQALLGRLRGRTASREEEQAFSRGGGRPEAAGYTETKQGRQPGEEGIRNVVRATGAIGGGLGGAPGMVGGGAAAEYLLGKIDEATGRPTTGQEHVQNALTGGGEGAKMALLGGTGGLALKGANYALRGASPLVRAAGGVAADTLATGTASAAMEGRLPSAGELATGAGLTGAFRGGQHLRALRGARPSGKHRESIASASPKAAAAPSAPPPPPSPTPTPHAVHPLTNTPQRRYEAAKQGIRELEPPRSVGEEYRAMQREGEQFEGFGKFSKQTGQYRPDIHGGVDEPPPGGQWMHGKKPEGPKGQPMTPEQEAAYEKAFNMPPGEARDAALRAAVAGKGAREPLPPSKTQEQLQGEAQEEAARLLGRRPQKDPLASVERRRSERAASRTPEEEAAERARRGQGEALRAAEFPGGAGKVPPGGKDVPPADKPGEEHFTPGHKGTLKGIRALHQHARENPKPGHEQVVYDDPKQIREHFAKFGDEPIEITTGKNATAENPAGTERKIRLTKKEPSGFPGWKQAGSRTKIKKAHNLYSGFEVDAKGEYRLDPTGPGGYAYREVHLDEPVTAQGHGGNKPIQFIASEKLLETLERQGRSIPGAREGFGLKDRFSEEEMGGAVKEPLDPARKLRQGDPEPQPPFGFVKKGKVAKEGPLGGAMGGQFGRQPSAMSQERIPVVQGPKRRPRAEQGIPQSMFGGKPEEAGPPRKLRQGEPAPPVEEPRALAPVRRPDPAGPMQPGGPGVKEGTVDRLIRKGIRGSGTAVDALGRALDLPEASIRRLFGNPSTARAALTGVGYRGASGMKAAAGISAAGFAGRRLREAGRGLRNISRRPGTPAAVRRFSSENDIRAIREALEALANKSRK